ncbi:MAG: PEP-CTERM sorting domain-containing protein [Verrucomicrobiota bacterium]|jgi:hypothetical protein
MKKTLLIGLFSAMALGAYAQGTINFNDRAGDATFHIYSPQTSGVAQNGSTATDVPAGSFVFGSGSVLIGGSSGAAGLPVNYGLGNNFTAQLYAAPGTGDAVSSLLPVTQYVALFRQTPQAVLAGTFIPATPSPDAGIPNTSGGSATVAVAAWYNAGGTITSLAEAQADLVPWGESLPVNLTALGTVTGTPVPNPAEDLIGIQSFSLQTQVPEPSTIALCVLGAGAFLARRKK